MWFKMLSPFKIEFFYSALGGVPYNLEILLNAGSRVEGKEIEPQAYLSIHGRVPV